GGIASILLLLLNGLVSLALLVLAIITAVQARGRGRTGAIIVGGTIVAAIVLYWLLVLVRVIASEAAGPGAVGAISIVTPVLEGLRFLLVAAALIVGAVMTRRWAKQNAWS